MAILAEMRKSTARWLLAPLVSGPGRAKANPAGGVMVSGLNMSTPGNRDARVHLREGYQLNVVVYRCINQISRAAASVELEVVRRRLNGEEEVLENHPLLSLLKRPNPRQTWAQFLHNLLVDWRSTGEYFILKVQNSPNQLPRELWLLPPQNMDVKAGKGGLPSAYEYRGQTGIMRFEVDEVSGQSAIMHNMDYNPLNNWRGQSPLEAAGLSVDIHNHGLIWNRALLKNGARPSGALTFPGTVNDTSFSLMREEMDLLFSGSVNAARPMLLEGGMQWQEMGTNPKDMDFINSLKNSAEMVASALGVPFALVSPDSATYSNMETANLMLYEGTVLPLLGSALEAFNNDFAQALKNGERLRVNEDSISALEPRRKQKSDRLGTLAEKGILSRDEVRQELGYTARGGFADELFVGAGLIPIDEMGSQPEALPVPVVEDGTTEQEEADAVRTALMAIGYTHAEAEAELSQTFNLKAAGGSVTHFPTVGANQPVLLTNSSWPVFDFKFAAQLRLAAPGLWAKAGGSADAAFAMWAEAREAKGARVDAFVRQREQWAAKHARGTRLVDVVAQVKWGVVGALGLDGMKKLLEEELESMKAKGMDVRKPGEIRAGDFVDLPGGRKGKVVNTFASSATQPARLMAREWVKGKDGAWEMGFDLISAELDAATRISPLG